MKISNLLLGLFLFSSGAYASDYQSNCGEYEYGFPHSKYEFSLTTELDFSSKDGNWDFYIRGEHPKDRNQYRASKKNDLDGNILEFVVTYQSGNKIVDYVFSDFTSDDSKLSIYQYRAPKKRPASAVQVMKCARYP